MATFTITHTCGHDSEAKLVGPASKVNPQIASLESRLCMDCYKSKQAEVAKVITQGRVLPDLEGSDKQVAWANTIRATILGQDKSLKIMLDTMSDRAHAEKVSSTMDAVVTKLGTITSAKWWIDNRATELRAFVNQAFQK